MKYVLLLGVMLMSVFAWAADAVPPETYDGLLAYLNAFIEAVGKGDWKIIGGIALMALMVVVRQLVLPKAKIDPDWIPAIQAAVSALAFAGMAMLSPDVTVGQALYNGVLTSGVAALAWELGGKWLFEKVLGAELYDKGRKK